MKVLEICRALTEAQKYLRTIVRDSGVRIWYKWTGLGSKMTVSRSCWRVTTLSVVYFEEQMHAAHASPERSFLGTL